MRRIDVASIAFALVLAQRCLQSRDGRHKKIVATLQRYHFSKWRKFAWQVFGIGNSHRQLPVGRLAYDWIMTSITLRKVHVVSPSLLNKPKPIFNAALIACKEETTRLARFV